MEATNKNKIGTGIINNVWVNFHKINGNVYYQTSSGLNFFGTFKDFKNYKNNPEYVKEFKSYPELMKVSFEYTDKFGEDANYSWVERKTVEVLENVSDIYLIRLAKKEMGINLRHKTPENIGDTIRLDFYKSNAVLFITFFQG